MDLLNATYSIHEQVNEEKMDLSFGHARFHSLVSQRIERSKYPNLFFSSFLFLKKNMPPFKEVLLHLAPNVKNIIFNCKKNCRRHFTIFTTKITNLMDN